MRLLLDSHALLWFLEGSSSLSRNARSAIEDVANEKVVSHVSAWEIAIKASLRKIHLAIPYEELFPDAVEANGFEVLPLDFRHYRELLNLPFHHRDPFDRLPIAQAKEERLTLVSCDPHFAIYGVPLIW
jgi:PIN domain nuclease of toxin-antitoxin system